MHSKLRKRIIVCAIAAALLCPVKEIHAWESLSQTALNVYEKEKAPTEPENPDTPPQPDSPSAPTVPETGNPPQEENKKPSQITPAETVTGKNDITTGDTCEFVFYLLLMLLSFAVLIILGVVLTVMAINEAEKRRRAA